MQTCTPEPGLMSGQNSFQSRTQRAHADCRWRISKQIIFLPLGCTIIDEEGVTLDENKYKYDHTVGRDLVDSAGGGTIYYTFKVKDVSAINATVTSPISKTAYVEYTLDVSANTMTLTVLPSFESYELQETTSFIKTTLQLTCIKGKPQSVIDMQININDTNNHDPVWDPKVAVPLNISMPFPNGFPVVQLQATDVDLANPGVEFSLDADGAKWFRFSPSNVVGLHNYATTLTTVQQLTFEKTITFVVTVKDSASPSRSSTATMTIVPDAQLSTPTSPRFANPIYLASVDKDMKPNSEIVFAPPVVFSEGYDESVTLSLGGTNSDLFNVALAGDGVKITLLAQLSDETLALPYIVLILEATRPKAANTGRTVILLTPPRVECEVTTTPEPTTSTTTTTTPATTPVECPTTTPVECPTTTPLDCPECPTTDSSTTTEDGATSPGECPVCPTDPTTEATTTTTTVAPTSEVPGSSIAFEKPDYSNTVAARFTGLVLQVTAVTRPDVMAITYAIRTQSENIRNRTAIDAAGRVFANLLPPGVHRFEATARVEGTNLFASTNIVVRVTSTETSGDEPGFAYSLTVIRVLENMEDEVIPPSETGVPAKSCVYSLVGDQGWFAVDNATGAVSSKKIDREDAIFAGQTTAQLTFQLHVECGDQGVTYRDPQPSVRSRAQQDCILVSQVDNSRQDMTVVAVIEDANDHSPVFVGPNPVVVGYPSAALLDQIQPSSLTTVLATDKDSGLHAQIAYSLVDQSEERFYVEPSSGVVYMMQSPDTFTDQNVSVLATDMAGEGNPSAPPLEIRVKILTEKYVSTIVMESALLGDVDDIVRELTDKTRLSVSVLSAYVVPRGVNEGRGKREVGADDDAGVRQTALNLVVYAVDYGQDTIVTAEELARKLDNLEFQWTILEVHPLEPNSVWEVADNAGLLAATISLGVICGILLIASGVLLFFSYIKPRMDRNSHMSGLIDHGYENSGSDLNSDSSFGRESQDESVKQVDAWMLEDAKSPMALTAEADAYLTMEDGIRSQSSSDASTYDDSVELKSAVERKKSIVTFNESVDCIEIERI